MKKILLLLLLGLPACLGNAQRNWPMADSLGNLYKFAFGSCNKQNMMQEMWYNVVEEEPQLWIFLGDNIYGDSPDTSVLRKKYTTLLEKESFMGLASRIPYIGIWDDHDYGVNNGDSNFAAKKLSQQLFLDFMGVPAESARRRQRGIYTSYTFGEPDKMVKLFLLDTRYFRGKPDGNGDILGAEQWAWLEKEFKNSTARFNFICTSTQFLSDKKKSEKWADYPQSKQKMLDLIRSTGISGVIFLSGDIHCGEILRCKEGVPYPIYEFTSSGLTHGNWLSPKKNKQYTLFKRPYCGKNFGMLRINWNEPVSIRYEIRSIQNFVEQECTVYLDDLREMPN